MSKASEIIEKYKVDEKDKKTSTPTQFRIGKTYHMPDGGQITITDIYIDRVHLDKGGDAYLEYTFISPKGQKGKEKNPVSSIQKWYKD